MFNSVFFSLLILLLLTGCSSMDEAGCNEATNKVAEISDSEAKHLHQLIMANEFYSGCVTEEISDLAERLCENNTNCRVCQSDEPSQYLRYSQWLTIYNKCMAK